MSDASALSSKISVQTDLESDVILEILQGTTLKIYWFLLAQGESGIREIQRGLKLSSTNMVSYHIKKILSAGLIVQNPVNEKYKVKKKIRAGLLSLYTHIGKFLIPQNVFLVVFFLTMTLSYVILMLFPRGYFIAEDIFFLSVSAAGMVFLIRQTTKIWQLNPL